MSDKIYTCPVVEDSDGELAIEFSDEILEKLDLKVGDTIIWSQTKEGVPYFYKKEDDNGNEEG